MCCLIFTSMSTRGTLVKLWLLHLSLHYRSTFCLFVTFVDLEKKINQLASCNTLTDLDCIVAWCIDTDPRLSNPTATKRSSLFSIRELLHFFFFLGGGQISWCRAAVRVFGMHHVLTWHGYLNTCAKWCVFSNQPSAFVLHIHATCAPAIPLLPSPHPHPALCTCFHFPSLFLSALIFPPSESNKPDACPITGCVLRVGSG